MQSKPGVWTIMLPSSAIYHIQQFEYKYTLQSSSPTHSGQPAPHSRIFTTDLSLTPLLSLIIKGVPAFYLNIDTSAKLKGQHQLATMT